MPSLEKNVNFYPEDLRAVNDETIDAITSR